MPYGLGAVTSAAPAAQVVAETDIVLRDGSTMHVRPSTTEDVPRLRTFLESLSDQSRWFRYFSAGVDLDGAARSAAAPDDGLALIALREATVVGHGTYIRGPAGRAEVAFAVADVWHGHGIATVLLAHLAHAASTAGIDTFTATVLSDNHRMLGVFHESGFLVSARPLEGAIEIEFPTSLSRDAERRFAERQREADVAAVGHVLRPSSVAVIGASKRPGTVGGEVVRNLIAAGFAGPLHLVNLRGGEVAGRPTVPTIADVEGEVELAVIVVPANAVVDVARACAAKGVRALVVLSAGFADVGPAGRALQDELLAVCRAAGMRMVGPNCLGVASPRPEIALNTTVAPAAPPPGDVGFASQSGGFGSAAIDAATARGIGFSSFVTMGDKADLSGNDFLEYWEQDPDTAVMLLYLDSFGNPRRFGLIARRITTAKPIVAVKSARTAGRRAAWSHTGALLAAADVTVDALFAHAGVLRAETVGEMFDVAGLLARQPLPPGDRVAVLTNAGGPGVACEDACEAAGLRVEPLSEVTRKQLAEVLPAQPLIANPLDMTASATADHYERSLRHLLDDDAVDAVVTIFVRPLAARAGEVARGIAAAAQGADQPVLTVWLGADAPAAADTGSVPRFSTPEEAVRALAHAVGHARRRAAPPDPPFEPADADTASAATTVAEGLGRGGGWLARGDVERLMRCWGIPVEASRLVASARAAGRVAADLGGPVALKAVAPGLVHKSDAGAVRLGLNGPTAVRRAAGELARQMEAAGTTLEGFHVQRMAPPRTTELIVGAVRDPAFGPLVACGPAGVAVELLGDIQVRLAPLGPREADNMLRDLKTFPLLDGYRGRPRADLGSLRDLVMRVGALVAAHPAVAELDLNPVFATPEGAFVVDARVRVDAPGPAAPFPSLNR